MLHNQKRKIKEKRKKKEQLHKDLWANEIFSSAQQNGDTFPFL